MLTRICLLKCVLFSKQARKNLIKSQAFSICVLYLSHKSHSQNPHLNTKKEKKKEETLKYIKSVNAD